MFDYDKWQEIFGTIRKNKLRTFLTVVGIAWGIFMIISLVGLGNGFEKGVTKGFGNWATNSGFMWGQRTTISYGGFQPGRNVSFDNSDTEILLTRVKEIRYLAPRNQLGGWRGGNNVTRKDKAGAFTVIGDYPEFNKINIQNIEQGRFINQKDIEDYRKVAIIGQNVFNLLFDEDEDPVGEYITINKVNFQVVGFIKPVRNDGNERDLNTIQIPFSTFQRAFGFGNRVGWYAFSAYEQHDVAEVQSKMLTLLREKNSIHPMDEDAIGHNNLQKEFEEISGLFRGLNLFTWFVGLSTLFAGIIGVSNIMLIIVKERTKEIGIRKSLGATPNSIIGLIVQESIFLTMFGGYFALIIGLMILDVLTKFLPEDFIILNPSVSPGVAIGSLVLLVIGGIIAGVLPAQKAARINPIEAIRQEN
jgi:putative ABC transport system permease protein